MATIPVHQRNLLPCSVCPVDEGVCVYEDIIYLCVSVCIWGRWESIERVHLSELSSCPPASIFTPTIIQLCLSEDWLYLVKPTSMTYEKGRERSRSKKRKWKRNSKRWERAPASWRPALEAKPQGPKVAHCGGTGVCVVLGPFAFSPLAPASSNMAWPSLHCSTGTH